MQPRWGQIRENTTTSLSVTFGVLPISRAHDSGPLPEDGSYSLSFTGKRITTPGTLAALNPSGVYCGYFWEKTKYLESHGFATSESLATEMASPRATSCAVGA